MTDQPPNKPTGILLYLPLSDGPGPYRLPNCVAVERIFTSVA